MNYIFRVNYEDIEYTAALENEDVDKVEELEAEDVMIDLDGEADSYEELTKKFDKVFWKGIFTFIPEPIGYFGEKGCFNAFNKAMYAASNYFERNASKLSVKVETKDGQHEIPGLKKDVIKILIQYNEVFHRLDQDTRGNWIATVAAGCLNKFIKNGEWELAMLNEDNKIITDPLKWPDLEKDANGKAKWIKDGKEYKPIIYFSNSYEAIKCWSLCEDNKNWKSFWFGEKGLLDWKQLGLNENSINCMNLNESIEKPDLTEIREACPINLDKNDTQEQMLDKVEQHFVKYELVRQSARRAVEMSKAEREKENQN